MTPPRGAQSRRDGGRCDGGPVLPSCTRGRFFGRETCLVCSSVTTGRPATGDGPDTAALPGAVVRAAVGPPPPSVPPAVSGCAGCLRLRGRARGARSALINSGLLRGAQAAP